MGVDLFFVLSGFLITGILLDTRASASRFYFGGFYGRRVLRIAPAFLALMAALTVAPALTGQNATAHGVFIQHETWYWTFLANGHRLFTVEPNHGEVDRISRNGKIERVVDVSASQGHILPTSIAHHGVFYLANLGTFPLMPGTEKLFQLTPHGQLHLRLTGLTAVTSLAFDHKHRLYALETSGCPTASCPGPVPGTGRVVRIDDNGRLVPIVTGLTTPTGMAFGPDGKLYISNNGYGAPPGAGEIVRVEVPKE
jgi:hypothetical protein